MKFTTKLHFFILCMLIISAPISACPTCIGRLDSDTPPFFTDEYDEHLDRINDNHTTKSITTTNIPKEPVT